MATPFDRIVVPSSLPTAGSDDDSSTGNDAGRRAFPVRLGASLLEQGWAMEDYFGQPAAYHRTHGVVTHSSDGFVACPRNGRPHAGFFDLESACAHCATAEPAEADAPCPLASALGDLVSGPSLLVAVVVMVVAFTANQWAHHGMGWPF